MEAPHPRWPLLALLALALAFENFWMWSDSRLVFGVPTNLAYHVGLCVAATGVLAAVVRWGWPGNPDE